MCFPLIQSLVGGLDLRRSELDDLDLEELERCVSCCSLPYSLLIICTAPRSTPPPNVAPSRRRAGKGKAKSKSHKKYVGRYPLGRFATDFWVISRTLKKPAAVESSSEEESVAHVGSCLFADSVSTGISRPWPMTIGRANCTLSIVY